MRQTAKGTSVLKFSLAVNESIKNAQGEWENYPTFIDCTVWGARADAISPYMIKGQHITIVGRLHQSRWEKDGQKYSRHEINVSDIEINFKDSKNQQQEPAQAPATGDVPF